MYGAPSSCGAENKEAGPWQYARDRPLCFQKGKLFVFFFLVVYQSKGEIPLAAELSVDLE